MPASAGRLLPSFPREGLLSGVTRRGISPDNTRPRMTMRDTKRDTRSEKPSIPAECYCPCRAMAQAVLPKLSRPTSPDGSKTLGQKKTAPAPVSLSRGFTMPAHSVVFVTPPPPPQDATDDTKAR